MSNGGVTVFVGKMSQVRISLASLGCASRIVFSSEVYELLHMNRVNPKCILKQRLRDSLVTRKIWLERISPITQTKSPEKYESSENHQSLKQGIHELSSTHS